MTLRHGSGRWDGQSTSCPINLPLLPDKPADGVDEPAGGVDKPAGGVSTLPFFQYLANLDGQIVSRERLLNKMIPLDHAPLVGKRIRCIT